MDTQLLSNRKATTMDIQATTKFHGYEVLTSI